mmetsp:Transcript_24357/g.44091  ORF Transcript_24357/g.44091 Transcript_24357/m.44091 type:complete len:223 (-) Transcript_24357:349-1017(-)|eukprot:CAMPEP_0197628470 /NCGR_PEP_ID=MMETSP1338-20131121/6770_1 /TAXON_ID=43686 ORGANISM="Pelagodinium beii, Strain RCC1491" /NCGR_SAMPLE_ID=MMETSP1338 /ASSEMBLY_ACC=CAM_ASM_000754 /LENGTH=222 /DNA_ID=CAMNT_0043199451 /DNA_START=124 /DNA_END=792 /DNA_ORIENTATION=-
MGDHHDFLRPHSQLGHVDFGTPASYVSAPGGSASSKHLSSSSSSGSYADAGLESMLQDNSRYPPLPKFLKARLVADADLETKLAPTTEARGAAFSKGKPKEHRIRTVLLEHMPESLTQEDIIRILESIGFDKTKLRYCNFKRRGSNGHGDLAICQTYVGLRSSKDVPEFCGRAADLGSFFARPVNRDMSNKLELQYRKLRLGLANAALGQLDAPLTVSSVRM